MKYISVLILILLIFVSGCATASEVPPTSTPKPTWTLRPHGVLKACIYFDGNIVDLGYLTFKDEEGDLKDLNTELVGGCKDIFLPPGYYHVTPHYYQGACSDSTAVCIAGEFYQIDISVGEVIDQDFELFLPD